MDVMSTLVLAGIGALFSSAMFMMGSWKGLNHKRDCIILGIQEGVPLRLEHRQLMLDHDWLPLLIGTILLHIFYGIILLVAPLLLTNEEGAAFIWLFLSCLPSSNFLVPMAGRVAGTKIIYDDDT